MKRCLTCNELFVSAGWNCPACGFAPPVADGISCFAPEFSKESEGYDPSRYETIHRFQKEHFWFRGRNELIGWHLARHFPAARSFLEIGCGTGQVLGSIREAQPGLHLCGTEIHSQGLVYARGSLPGVDFFQMDARAIPFRQEFDVVGAFDVIEHVDDDIGVLREMHGACTPGGGILLTVPQHRWLWSYKDDIACHKRRYARNELVDKVAAAGFEVAAVTSFVSLLLPLMYISRLRERTSANRDPQREFRISPTANSCFMAVARFENAMIRVGVSFPVGGSLLLVAKKPIK